MQISWKLAPLHHWRTASIISTLKLCTYSSSTSAMPLSVETLAIRLAVSCRIRSGPASSSFSLTLASDWSDQHLISRVTIFDLPVPGTRSS